MSEREKILHTAQFMALCTFTTYLGEIVFKMSGDPRKCADQILTRAEVVASKTVIPEFDPVISDAIAQEYRDSLIRLILRVKSAALGEPLDPETFQQPQGRNP